MNYFRSHRRHQRSEAAITLLEVVVSASLIAMVSTGLIFSQLMSNQIAMKSRNLSSAKVVLRELVDRFQSVDGNDLMLEVTAGYSNINMGIADDDSTQAGVQVTLFNEGASSPVLGTIQRQVAVMASTGSVILLSASFKITYSEQGTAVTRIMSTNRCIP